MRVKPIVLYFFFLSSSSLAEITFERTYGGPDAEEGISVKQISDGGYIITGYKLTAGSDYDIYLIKTNENGDSDHFS
jgi:hypothetical protein